MRELLGEVIDALQRRRPCVWCSVVATRGSTPQKAGAAMLVYDDGTQSGTLGGGCVEAEVKRRALHGLHAGAGPAVLSFNLDDDFGWDDGLICGGRMTILAHPLQGECAATSAYYDRLREIAESGAGFTEAIIISDEAGLTVGERYLFDADGKPRAHLAGRPKFDSVKSHLVPIEERPRPATHGGIAYLPSPPRITVLLVGGGHVAQAVAQLAAQVDFEVWVLDDRERFANRERFPAATNLIVGDIGETLRALVPKLTPATFALVVTRGHNHDEEALFHLAGARCGYVGMIGSKRKIRLIFDDLIARGVSAESLARVHAPLGLEIGSQTVPEIAVSIVAELIACRNLGALAEAGVGAMIAAVVPAAGQSSRMGRCKLALPIGDRTVLERVVAALRAGGAECVLVVIAQSSELMSLAIAAGADVCVLPAATAEMRATVEYGLGWLEERLQPRFDDAWLLAPGDYPAIDGEIVRDLVAAYVREPAKSIVVPVHNGQRGHPVLIAWRHVAGIRAMPAGLGIDAYLHRHPGETLELPVASAGVLADLDTPADYQRVRMGEGEAPAEPGAPARREPRPPI